MGKKWIGILVCVLLAGSIIAQPGISLSFAPSKVIKHRSSLLFDVPPSTQEFRFSFIHQTDGDESWERYWKLPTIALNAGYVNFGDREVLGRAYSFLPELQFTLRQWNQWNMKLYFGTGIAYLDRPYHPTTNPVNTAIGSNFNNTTSLKFGFQRIIANQWRVGLLSGLVHFSNGLSSSPNSGINIYGADLSIGYIFNRRENGKEDNSIRYESFGQDSLVQYSKIITDIQYHYGITESTVPGGPKYRVDVISAGIGYRYNRYMTFFLGGEYEYNNGTYTFFKNNFSTDEESRQKARSGMIYLENELLFGRVFNRLRIGYYLPWTEENRSTYIKLQSGIYLPSPIKNVKPNIGVLLKSHTAVADYIAITAGFSIEL